ncbi:hypothetical protein F4808DRAFT_465646 [Astrocystis sublimbata]|nr:hypothetical protein F4808DRAFT_465646 [Astrocystis sublimbata]
MPDNDQLWASSVPRVLGAKVPETSGITSQHSGQTGLESHNTHLKIKKIAQRLLTKDTASQLLRNSKLALQDWIHLLELTTLPAVIASSDPAVATRLGHLDYMIVGNHGKFISRLARIQFVQVMGTLEAIIAKERSSGLIQPQRKRESAKNAAYRKYREASTRPWIFTELAVEISLDTDPTYQKIAMKGTDVGVTLHTLWSRADDIPYNPDTRVSFHAIILLAAIGGFRPAVARDPINRTRTQVVMTINIKRNKIKETAKTSRARNGGSIGFFITFISNYTFCLSSLILTRGIQTNVFDPSFSTVDQIFDRPNLEHMDFIPLRWKADMLKKKIFSISYKTLNELWHLVLLVSGAREDARLYSLRVGTGSNLDGVLSDALRNYVLSHTTHVFESSYQSFRVRADLMQLAFKTNAGDHGQLFTRLCDVSLGRDTNAPVIDPLVLAATKRVCLICSAFV